MQKVINRSVPKGVWFTSEIYNADTDFMISGISLSDKGIIDFIEKLRFDIENMDLMDLF